MACPRCGSNDLWDDNLWYGCNKCGYASGPDGGTMLFAKDVPGLMRTVRGVETGVEDPRYRKEEDD